MATPQLFAADATSTPGRSPASGGPNPPARAPGANAVNLSAPASLADEALAGRIRNLFQRARTHRATYVNQWVKNHRIMRNRTWSMDRPSNIPAPEVPEIRPIIASCVAWVTDQRPSFELVPAAQPFSPFYNFYNDLANDMKVAVNAVWQTYGWEAEIEKVVWDGYQYDVGYMKVIWDAALADGLGDVSLKRIDPFTFYPDPQATCMDDANYFIEARTISLQELDRRFPGAATKFELHGYQEFVDSAPTPNTSATMPRANPGAIAPSTDTRYGLPGQTREHVATDDNGVTLLEAWVREHSTREDSDGNVRVYDCWRCIVVAGPFVLLNKRADDLFPFTTHPYTRYVPEDIGGYYEQSMVELLAPSQIAINRLLSAIQLSIELTGNPPFVEETRSGLQRTKIPNEPGTRLTVNPGAKAEWMTVPPMHQGAAELVKFYIGEMERISGLSAISLARAQGGRMAGDQLDSLQEAGFARIRLALRNLERGLCRVGQLVTAVIGEFYTAPRLASIVGPDGLRTSLALRGRHFYVPTPEGEEPLRFTIMVHAGSMLPTSRQARVAEADTLFSMNGIDRPALLEAHDWPGRQAVIERMAEMDAKGTSQTGAARQRANRTS